MQRNVDTIVGDCVWVETTDGGWICNRCRKPYLGHRPQPPHRNCSKSRGLGDTIAKITHAIGIKPCGGCKKRQAMLNRLFPYRQNSPIPNADDKLE